MATVTIKHLWINVAADPSIGREFPLGEMEPIDAVQAEVKEYLNGRRRVSRKSGGPKRTLRALLREPFAEDVAWLVDWLGEVMFFRDLDGAKFAGMYAEVPQSRKSPAREDLTLYVTETSFDEAV
jgi:hypothetical protein